MLLVHYTKEQAVFTYNSRTIRALEVAQQQFAKMASSPAKIHTGKLMLRHTSGARAPIYGELLARLMFTDIRSTISSTVILLWGATSYLAAT